MNTCGYTHTHTHRVQPTTKSVMGSEYCIIQTRGIFLANKLIYQETWHFHFIILERLPMYTCIGTLYGYIRITIIIIVYVTLRVHTIIYRNIIVERISNRLPALLSLIWLIINFIITLLYNLLLLFLRCRNTVYLFIIMIFFSKTYSWKIFYKNMYNLHVCRMIYVYVFLILHSLCNSTVHYNNNRVPVFTPSFFF